MEWSERKLDRSKQKEGGMLKNAQSKVFDISTPPHKTSNCPQVLKATDQEVGKYVTSCPLATKCLVMIWKKRIRFRMIQEYESWEEVQKYQTTRYSSMTIAGGFRAATFSQDRLNLLALPVLRKSINICSHKEEMRQLRSTLLPKHEVECYPGDFPSRR